MKRKLTFLAIAAIILVYAVLLYTEIPYKGVLQLVLVLTLAVLIYLAMRSKR